MEPLIRFELTTRALRMPSEAFNDVYCRIINTVKSARFGVFRILAYSDKKRQIQELGEFWANGWFYWGPTG